MALRKSGKDVPVAEHRCSYSVMQHGTGHSDLDKIMESASPLCFEFELLRVEQPGDYEPDHWAMTDDEKSAAVVILKEEGNTLYRGGEYKQASEKYFEALRYLEEQIIKEKPQSEAWYGIAKRKVPLLLNYAQCKLLMQDYVDTIRHTTSVLEVEPGNVKALYRRGKAHAASWDVEEATRDLRRAAELDTSLVKPVEKELKAMAERVKEKDVAEKERLKGKLFT
jgi:AH receptor-interacting protein